MVHHPDHYKRNGMEAIDVIEAFELNFHLANAVKYILRAGRKDPSKTTQDLQKSVWYILRYIDKLTK